MSQYKIKRTTFGKVEVGRLFWRIKEHYPSRIVVRKKVDNNRAIFYSDRNLLMKKTRWGKKKSVFIRVRVKGKK